MSLIKTTKTLIIFSLFITTLAYAKTAEDYFNSGVKKGESGDWVGAIKDFSKAIELNPNYALAYYNRGAVKIRLGQKDNGCSDFSKASELNLNEANVAIQMYCN